jgi:regulator of replication initiation timing
MKLAEALLERADAQRRYAQVEERVRRFSKVQEGEAPAENPAALLAELDAIAKQIEKLVKRINQTNNVTAMAKQSLADALAERDALSMQAKTYAELAKMATVTQDRYSKSEVRFVSTIDVAATQKRADDLAKRYRELDATIQALNWTTELAV